MTKCASPSTSPATGGHQEQVAPRSTSSLNNKASISNKKVAPRSEIPALHIVSATATQQQNAIAATATQQQRGAGKANRGGSQGQEGGGSTTIVSKNKTKLHGSRAAEGELQPLLFLKQNLYSEAAFDDLNDDGAAPPQTPGSSDSDRVDCDIDENQNLVLIKSARNNRPSSSALALSRTIDQKVSDIPNHIRPYFQKAIDAGILHQDDLAAPPVDVGVGKKRYRKKRDDIAPGSEKKETRSRSWCAKPQHEVSQMSGEGEETEGEVFFSVSEAEPAADCDNKNRAGGQHDQGPAGRRNSVLVANHVDKGTNGTSSTTTGGKNYNNSTITTKMKAAPAGGNHRGRAGRAGPGGEYPSTTGAGGGRNEAASSTSQQHQMKHNVKHADLVFGTGEQRSGQQLRTTSQELNLRSRSLDEDFLIYDNVMPQNMHSRSSMLEDSVMSSVFVSREHALAGDGFYDTRYTNASSSVSPLYRTTESIFSVTQQSSFQENVPLSLDPEAVFADRRMPSVFATEPMNAEAVALRQR
ncbi:unnamed protein product, partial [Amoebophrya sp. A25]|eukprot:GSA25T00003045001.1